MRPASRKCNLKKTDILDDDRSKIFKYSRNLPFAGDAALIRSVASMKYLRICIDDRFNF
jgi:hypothetical protein